MKDRNTANMKDNEEKIGNFLLGSGAGQVQEY
jgi:hypothetical protein